MLISRKRCLVQIRSLFNVQQPWLVERPLTSLVFFMCFSRGAQFKLRSLSSDMTVAFDYWLPKIWWLSTQHDPFRGSCGAQVLRHDIHTCLGNHWCTECRDLTHVVFQFLRESLAANVQCDRTQDAALKQTGPDIAHSSRVTATGSSRCRNRWDGKESEADDLYGESLQWNFSVSVFHVWFWMTCTHSRTDGRYDNNRYVHIIS